MFAFYEKKSEFKKLLKGSPEGKTSVDGNTHGVAEKSKFKRNRAKVIFTFTVSQDNPLLGSSGRNQKFEIITASLPSFAKC